MDVLLCQSITHDSFSSSSWTLSPKNPFPLSTLLLPPVRLSEPSYEDSFYSPPSPLLFDRFRFWTVRELVKTNKSLVSWEVLEKKVSEIVGRMSRKKASGSHGLSKPMDYSKPGRPHYSDKETGEKALSLMRTYFETKPAEPVPVLFKSFEVPKQNSQTTTILFDDVNRIPLDRLSDSSWKAHFPGATEDFYQKLANPGCNTQQDLLKDENLLKELTGNVYFKSESGLKDMFWLESVGSPEEVYELSILQCFIFILSLYYQTKRNCRGWCLLTMGIHAKQANPIREYVQAGQTNDMIVPFVESLFGGYAIFELRFEKWVSSTIKETSSSSPPPPIFDKQRECIEDIHKKFDATRQQMTLSTKIFRLIEEFWLSIARGTVLHRDKKDIGLSLLFYLGFGWENTPSFGLTELGYIWKHSPGSVAGIRAATYYHMSLKNENGFRIMGAGFVNPISKKKK